jgi:transcriptional regulator with XRE-family HTH domain
MHWSENPEELKMRRKSLGLTQAMLGKSAKVSGAWVNLVERGKINIGANAQRPVKEKMHRVWCALATIEGERKGVPLADLLDPEKTKKMFSRASPIDTKAIIRQAQEEFRRKEQEDADFRVLREVTTNLLKDNQDLRAQVAELRGRVNLLADLLGVKLKEVGAAAEAEDLQAKLER